MSENTSPKGRGHTGGAGGKTNRAVIVGGARTAFGRFGGIHKDRKAVELGAEAIGGAIKQAGVAAADIDAVLMGMVLQAGAGQNPARQAARLAGLDWTVAADTINKVCASGLRAVTMADQMIRAGDVQVAVAGGMESMSGAPYALNRQVRWGLRTGDTALIDLMTLDGLQCAFANVPMAVHGSRVAKEYGITREEQDEWALRSHMRALTAAAEGRFAKEIAASAAAAATAAVVSGANGSGMPLDECPRADTDLAKLARLTPLYMADGTITAGNAPGVNDGAAALIVMSQAEAENRYGPDRPLARIEGHATVGAEAPYIAATPALAIRKLLKQTGLDIADIARFEVNEAFAAVVLTCGHMLEWDAEKVNVNGGAIALGHPIGASGARIVLTLIRELERCGGGYGIAAICSGGAQGDALLIRVDA
ncbi:acetyl-CoA C-acetyltransferase [Paenibacillus koleovorans]|uniref:acetyl-CoA C-acetyltransferase n=1 Tax=Paenibacillus koleovorans TaxID=121608 RepID=UPI000FD7A967|nr:acetyl-CoA C-acetyltransferase [Paenibacillus koleovorans]